MIKKIAALAGAGALLLSMAGPAFGFTLVKNKAKVKNIVVTKADTGDNSIHGKYVFGGEIITGDAGACALVDNDVNSSVVYPDDGALIIKNKAKVKNVVITKADTGDNSIGGKVVGGGGIDTGNAGASSIVTNFVNYSIVDEY